MQFGHFANKGDGIPLKFLTERHQGLMFSACCATLTTSQNFTLKKKLLTFLGSIFQPSTHTRLLEEEI